MNRRDFQDLIREQAPFLYAFLLHHGAATDDIPDLVQDTFAIAWDKRDTVPDAKARAYLTGVARRLLQAHIRKSRTHRNLEEANAKVIADALLPTAQRDRGAHAPHIERERREYLAALLEQLPERQAQAIRLTSLEDLSQAEAAERLGISRQAVAKRVKSGLDRLGELAREDRP